MTLFTEYWFSPDGPGGRAVIRRLNKRKLQVKMKVVKNTKKMKKKLSEGFIYYHTKKQGNIILLEKQ